MGLICIVIGLVEWIWCILMPIVGSLYFISSKNKDVNAEKTELFKHWCYYWVAYFVLNMLFGCLCFLPNMFSCFLHSLRVIALTLLASPKLNLTIGTFEYIFSKAGFLTGIKDTMMDLVVGLMGVNKKKAE